jgi:hypothetical protein
MCDPATLAIAGGLLGAAGSLSQGAGQAAALRRQAELTRRSAEFELERFGEETEALRSRQRVASAKSGVRETGTVLDVQRQSAEDAELEALNIQFGAEAGVQARLFEAKQAERAGKIGAVTSLLGTARSIR